MGLSIHMSGNSGPAMGTEPVKIQARLRGAAAPIALSFALLAQPAFAQDDSDTEVTANDILENFATTAEPVESEAIIVTGSRIRRTKFTSPDPITIINPEIAQQKGQFSTAQMLQSSPIAAGSAQVTAAVSGVLNTDGGLGAETISLRGLGANRTLVLLNGRGPALRAHAAPSPHSTLMCFHNQSLRMLKFSRPAPLPSTVRTRSPAW